MRATPICHRLMALPVVYGSDNYISTVPHFYNDPGSATCLGSRCSMWHARNDNTPARNLGCCAENKTAVPWVDPAVKEGK